MTLPTVRQLEYLIAIADVKHFRRAAEKVNTTQPTLSGQLKALEERLGVELVERSRSRVVMTPAGAEIVDVARRVLRDVREIRAMATSHNKKLAGLIRLGLSPSVGPYLVPRVVPDLRREYPDLKFYVREEDPVTLPNSLGDGTFDLIIMPLPLSGEYEIQELYQEPMQLFVPSNDPMAKHPVIKETALKNVGFLALTPGHPLHDLVNVYCLKVGAKILRDYEGTSLDTLREMVGMGMGAAFLPALFAKSQGLAKDKTIRQIEIEGEPLCRTVVMAWRRSSARPKRYVDLSEFIKQSVARTVGPL
jgi:LysR family hydrogen peroxide-inducible transcriptional activator